MHLQAQILKIHTPHIHNQAPYSLSHTFEFIFLIPFEVFQL